MSPFIHRCVVRSGSLAGNKVATEVSATDYEFRETCEHCGERLATGRQLLAHIYGELLQAGGDA